MSQYKKQNRKREADSVRSEKDEEIEILSSYLSQYRKAKRRKAILERRLAQIRDDMQHPISAVGYTPINSPTNEIGAGAASFTFRTSDCELKIYEQADEAAKDLLKVMDIMDYLEKNSDEREALELYYIDGHGWEYVAEKMDVSRSQVYNFRRTGLEKLLTFKRVREILKRYEAGEDEK